VVERLQRAVDAREAVHEAYIAQDRLLTEQVLDPVLDCDLVEQLVDVDLDILCTDGPVTVDVELELSLRRRRDDRIDRALRGLRELPDVRALQALLKGLLVQA